MLYDYRLGTPATEYRCLRCGARTEREPDICAACFGPLCYPCWDEHGVCLRCERIRAAAEQARETDHDI